VVFYPLDWPRVKGVSQLIRQRSDPLDPLDGTKSPTRALMHESSTLDDRSVTSARQLGWRAPPCHAACASTPGGRKLVLDLLGKGSENVPLPSRGPSGLCLRLAASARGSARSHAEPLMRSGAARRGGLVKPSEYGGSDTDKTNGVQPFPHVLYPHEQLRLAYGTDPDDETAPDINQVKAV